MPNNPAKSKPDVLPKSSVIYLEALVVILLASIIMVLQKGSFQPRELLTYQSILTIGGSLSVWFVNRFILEKILQSRIESDRITRFLPFELLAASILATSIVYVIYYFIISYINQSSFILVNFLIGLSLTIGLSLLIVVLYLGNHIWKSWWSDGEFLFHKAVETVDDSHPKDFITIENPKGTLNLDLNKVMYFTSESKIVFLVDSSNKKWITQYNLAELEKILDGRYFRLNRSILVSRQVISQIKKLPNHRLLVTIGHLNNNHFETISRYRSTRFKQWFHDTQ